MSTIQTRSSTKKNISNWSNDDVGSFLSSNIITRKYRAHLSNYRGQDLISANDSTLAAEGIPFFARKYLLRKVHSLSQEENISTLKSNPINNASCSPPSSPKLSHFKPINLNKLKEQATDPVKELKDANETKEGGAGGVVFSLRRFQRLELRRGTRGGTAAGGGGGSGLGSSRDSPPSKRRRHSKPEEDENQQEEVQQAKLLVEHYLNQGGEQFAGLYDYLNRNRQQAAAAAVNADQELCTFSYHPPEKEEEEEKGGNCIHHKGEVEKYSLVSSLKTEEELCVWFECNNMAEAVPYLLCHHITPQLLCSQTTKLRDLLPLPEPKWKKLESLLWTELPPLDHPTRT